MPLKYIYVFYICSLLFFISCSNDEGNSSDNPDTNPPIENSLYFPPVDSDAWETISISDLNWNTNQEQTLYDFLEDKGTKAFIILKNGKIVIEKYFNGGSSTEHYPWYSAAKTLSAFMVGIAQQEGELNINSSSSTYLGSGWANITANQEQDITVLDHLTMTTGLDYNVDNENCTDQECLSFLNTPGTFWYYHNATYNLVRDIVTNATGISYNDYFREKVGNETGMNGTWLSLGYSNVFYSTARSMARFGLLNLNEGKWDTTTLMEDQEYFTAMTTTSQEHNKAYGYLWWLNGKDSFRSPSLEIEFPGALMPSAPTDLIAGLGKNDQKLYVVPSENLVIVRLGDDSGESLLGPSSFDNDLWDQLNLLMN